MTTTHLQPHLPQHQAKSTTQNPQAGLPNLTQGQHLTSHDVEEKATESAIWWGEFALEHGQTRAWQLGSFQMRLSRTRHEWQLEYYRDSYQKYLFNDDSFWYELADHAHLNEPLQLERFFFGKTPSKLWVVPRAADRSMVCRPINPVFIPPKQRGMIYVSTPVWLTAYVDMNQPPLFDIPLIRPNDTWFGPDTLSGEICYATPVFARTELAMLPPNPFWILTPIEFRNLSNQQIKLERLNLPTPYLPVVWSEHTGRLWTNKIDVIQETGNPYPKIRMDTKTPKSAGKVSFVAPPRIMGSRISNMFDSLFD